ncbi:MAG: hypothetical protein R2832_01150 [Rhodothermales bacterium]
MMLRSGFSPWKSGRLFVGTFAVALLFSFVNDGIADGSAREADYDCLVYCNIRIVVTPTGPSEMSCDVAGQWLCYPAFAELIYYY